MPTKQLKIRKLRASEVTFTLELEPEETPYRGNCSAVDPDTDRETEEWIRKRLAAEQHEAWCTLVVKATWEGIEGFGSLGCVSLDAGQHADGPTVARHAEQFARDSDMYSQALEHLNQEVQRQAERGLELVNRLKIAEPRPKRQRHYR